MKSKPFAFLTRLLIFLLLIVFIVLPLIWSFRDGDVIGFVLPMAAIALWLLGAGKLNLFGITMEGRQAYAVGGAMLTPVMISAIVNNTGLPSWIANAGIFTGLAGSVFLYFRVKPTRVTGERTIALILSAVGIVLALIGTSMTDPSDQAGTILVEGIPVVPFNSVSLILQIMGFIVFLGGLFGLIFGFKSGK